MGVVRCRVRALATAEKSTCQSQFPTSIQMGRLSPTHVVVRLRLDSGLAAPDSIAARDHGDMRREQGYTVPMVVEESRILQVSIFRTLQRNLRSVDFSKVLLDVVTIADEVDSQLKQALISFILPKVILKPLALGLA